MKLYIENLDNKWGWGIRNADDLISYLYHCEFCDDYVVYETIEEAVRLCASEIGCVYSNIEQLAADIRKYYI